MTARHHSKSRQRNKIAGILRQYQGTWRALLVASLVVLASCHSAGYKGELYNVDNFYGAVVGDEPRAVLVGRNLLAGGGNAVDAAVGTYFAMSVTLPSTAGLGGGGVCVVHRADEDNRADEVVEFLPRSASGGLVAVPGNVRGMAALAARYGKLKWSELVIPAENLANQGTTVSRALAANVKLAERKVRADPEMSRVFVRADGSLVSEGDNLVQPELGSVLAQVRTKGIAAIYGGLTGQQLAASAQSIGAPLTVEDLRNFLVQFLTPFSVELGFQNVYMPPPPAAGGISAAQMLSALDVGSPGDPVFLANASLRLAVDRAQWLGTGGDVSGYDQLATSDHVEALLQGSRPSGVGARPENPFSASVVAADREGMAVACAFTLNALFGSGRMAPGTGVILAPAPDERGFGFSALAPLIMANRHNGEFYFAASANGGLAGALAEAQILSAVAVEKSTLEAALLSPRVFNDGDPDVVYYDTSGQSDPGPALRAAGMQASQGGTLGQVNAIFCPSGSPGDPDTCGASADFRSDGIAAVVTKD